MIGKKSKIYISGSITHDPNYKSKFNAAVKFLRRSGYKPVNPIFGEKKNQSWEYYLKRDVRKLTKCDGIYLIPDWCESKGAQVEYNLAVTLKLSVISGKWSDLKKYGFRNN